MTDPTAPQRSTITAREGGIMTVEVGTITGEVEVMTSAAGEGVTTSVRYTGANEWYTPEGLVPGGADLATAHVRAVEDLSSPAPVARTEDPTDPAPGTATRQDATDPLAGGFGSALGH